MDNKKFGLVVQRQIKFSLQLLSTKGHEYAEKNPDRLIAFRRAAILQKCSPESALFGMLAKHLVSVADLCDRPPEDDGAVAKWSEKITDSINYLLLLRALVAERYGEV